MALALSDYVRLSLFTITISLYLAINPGIVKAAVTPIIPRVIKTSARVNAFENVATLLFSRGGGSSMLYCNSFLTPLT